MAERNVLVNNDPIEVSEKATVAELRNKAKLPSKTKVYDQQSGELLDDAQPAPDRIGTIEPFAQG